MKKVLIKMMPVFMFIGLMPLALFIRIHPLNLYLLGFQITGLVIYFASVKLEDNA